MGRCQGTYFKSRISLFYLKNWLTYSHNLRNLPAYAEVVELVDTLASGASGGDPVEVRVLFSVPLITFLDKSLKPAR